MRIISLSKFRFLVKNNFKWKTHYHNISEYNYNDKISCFHFSYISVDKFIIKFKKDKVQVCLKQIETELKKKLLELVNIENVKRLKTRE